jgi:2-methylcitrate dehydratase PrpD
VSYAAGLRANFGTMVKPLHAGHAARSGVEAALLARHGLTASGDPFHHRFGLFAAMAGDIDELADLADPSSFPVLTRLAFKPYPCCGEAMGAVQAAITLHRQVAGPVDAVEVRIGSFAREILEFDAPANADEARFSATYCAWRALDRGALTVEDLSDQAVEAASSTGYRDRVTVIVDPGLGHERAADVRVLADGRWVSERVVVPRGDPSMGYTDVDVRDKWHGCVPAERFPAGDAVLDQLFNVGTTERVGDLIVHLR